MEEHVMATSGDDYILSMLNRSLVDDYMISVYNRLLPDNSKPTMSFIEIPKTGSSATKKASKLLHIFRDESVMRPFVVYPPITFANVRHPISRFVSGIGTLAVRYRTKCSQEAKRDPRTPVRKKESLDFEVDPDLWSLRVPKPYFDSSKFVSLFCQKLYENGLNEIQGINHRISDADIGPIMDYLFQYGNSYPFSIEEGVTRQYLIHIISQMYFLNLYPPSKYYSTNQAGDGSTNFLLRLENLEDAINMAKIKFPSCSSLLPDSVSKPSSSSHHHRYDKKTTRFTCKSAWRIYQYFIQDFECLGYELPPECLKKECKTM